MNGQGRSMRGDEVQQVIHLLFSTDMTVGEIAERMSCSKSTVISINRRFQVREYGGLRSSWLKVNIPRTPQTEKIVQDYSSEREPIRKAAA